MDADRMKRRVEGSPLEAIPLDILIKVFCFVEYPDLRHLFHVSRMIRKATLIAKAAHFERSPEKKVSAFRLASELLQELEAPNAPLRRKSSNLLLKDRDFASMSMPIFPSLDEEM